MKSKKNNNKNKNIKPNNYNYNIITLTIYLSIIMDPLCNNTAIIIVAFIAIVTNTQMHIMEDLEK